MRSMTVVVLDVGAERALELAATEDQHPVEALAPHRADEALGEGVCLRGLHRCSNDRDPLSSKDLIERVGELAVAVVDQEPKRRPAPAGRGYGGLFTDALGFAYASAGKAYSTTETERQASAATVRAW
jgi:hypothetical protein